MMNAAQLRNALMLARRDLRFLRRALASDVEGLDRLDQTLTRFIVESAPPNKFIKKPRLTGTNA